MPTLMVPWGREASSQHQGWCMCNERQYTTLEQLAWFIGCVQGSVKVTVQTTPRRAPPASRARKPVMAANDMPKTSVRKRNKINVF